MVTGGLTCGYRWFSIGAMTRNDILTAAQIKRQNHFDLENLSFNQKKIINLQPRFQSSNVILRGS